MNKQLFRAAAAAGVLAIAWVAAGYLRSNQLALVMTLLIGAFYAMGVLELQRFANTTLALNRLLGELTTPPADGAALAQWLARVPAPLQTAVGLRVQGTRAALPGPALAPYLAGLLVLLGMLGTFVGMVVTLNGTSLALEQATNVQTMRDTLAAPVRGLGLAFGTSVAGVAASAMLGLMSALCRRERQQAGQLLDHRASTTLQAFSQTSQQQQWHQQAMQQRQHLHEQALAQQQSQQLQLLNAQQQWAEQAQRSQQQMLQQMQHTQHTLADQQAQFHDKAHQATSALALAVEHSLRQHIGQALQQGSTTLHAAVQASLQGIERQATEWQGQTAAAVQQQLLVFAQRFEAQSAQWLQTLGTQAQQQQALLVQALATAQAEQQAQHSAHDQQRLSAQSAALAALAAQVEQTGQRAAAQAEALARGTLAEVARLVHSATEAPRAASEAAAQVVSQLRDKLSDSLARDNAMLEERSRIMATLNTVLAAAQHTATEQKAAIDQMVATTSAWLQQAGARFTEQAQADAARLEAVSAQLTSSAVEVASLGEAFGAAVEQFSQGSGQMLTQLQSLEAALARSTARSDEQLAYYVAQAREVIDLSLLSQKQIVDDLQRLGGRAAASPVSAAGSRSTEAAASPALA